jgi:uncharacterized protein YbjT (DUF2867 family)
MMKILVTAPNGNIGRKVLPELFAPEFSVRVLARDPSCLPEPIRERVEVVPGSIDDKTALRQALQGAEALLWCVPIESLHVTNRRSDYESLALAVGQAIREAETPRVVTISSLGETPRPAARLNSGLYVFEEILNQSGAAMRHLRCGWLMENLLGQAREICGHGLLAYPISGQIPLPMVAAADIVEAVLRYLVRRDWAGVKSRSLFGPEHLSFNRAVSIIERVLDRPVRFTEISADYFLGNLVRSGAGAQTAHNVAATFAALAHGMPGAGMRPPAYPAQTTLARWTRDELLPLMGVFVPQLESEAMAVVSANAEPEISFLGDGL